MYLIYRVTNKTNHKVYIGATKDNIEKRKQNHYYRSRTNTGTKFHSEIATYGLDSFRWETIDTAFSIEELASKEKHYINVYDSQQNGYNNDRGGAFQKTIYKYSENGVYINRFSSLTEAAISVGVCKQAISKACLSNSKNCKGYFWSYGPLEALVQKVDKRCKKVFCYSLAGVFIKEYSSVADAARKTGYSESGISRVCRGERSTYKEHIWKY